MILLHVIDIGEKSLSVRGCERFSDADKLQPPPNTKRILIRDEADLIALSDAILLRIWNFLKIGKPAAKLASHVAGAAAVWALLQTPPAKTSAYAEAQQSSEESTMAAKSKKSKTNGNSLPREGTKKARLLSMLCRDGGATKAEMLAMTGWKAALGTAAEVAKAAGKKLEIIKEEGKVNRWVAK